MTDWALWGAPQWATPALILAVVGAVAVLWCYASSPASPGVRTLAAVLKLVGAGAFALCLVEPLISSMRPRPGANLFAVAVDNSQSLQITDADGSPSRGEQLRRSLLAKSAWQNRLDEDFDVRRFVFDHGVRGVEDFGSLDFEGPRSDIGQTLGAIERRFRSLPLGGVLLVTDGNTTDQLGDPSRWSELPPVYPVVIGADRPLPDLRVERVSVQQTNFEAAPITIQAEIAAVGMGGRPVRVTVCNEDGDQLETQVIELPEGRQNASVRFQVRPLESGLQFFQVTASAEQGEGILSPTAAAAEATEANNTRSVVVDNGQGPYRVLFVSGRPDWDYKFIRRALADDDQVELVGLIRIATKEPKFSFRRQGEGSSQLYEGFNLEDEETAERYDEPVLVRIGTEDEEELRDGFPKTADELYKFDAIVLDDIEAGFFSQDQLSMIEGFVSQRGGGLLMMGGVDSFTEGGYHRTPVGELLPVYLDGKSLSTSPAIDDQYRLTLTRDGWLQDWVRLRKTESEERARLAALPAFATINKVGDPKPGAVALAQVEGMGGEKRPALVAQRYGRGRSAALLIADMWRAAIRRPDVTNNDFEGAWRQTARWLVADVPRRVEVVATTQSEQAPSEQADSNGTLLRVRVHDAEYLPLENATVNVTVHTPDGKQVQMAAQADAKEAGVYVAEHYSRSPGPHRAEVAVTAPDGSEVGAAEAGWVAQPLADEFKRVEPNRQLLEEIAKQTGGEVLAIDDLDGFVAGLESRDLPVQETWVRPLWHHPLFFTLAAACLIGEWGLRRWKGLA